jgi:3-isopropylmalate/(R)-2-methylmalate dehydratase small subunit
MESFTTLTARAVPLRRSDVDTDQIIPASYLKRVTRSGFEDGLFAAWRQDPTFVLNDEQYVGAQILVAGRNFGTGSSREHAVWALQNYGFRVVLAPGFGDIFRGNAAKNGLLVVPLPDDVIDRLQTLAEKDPKAQITVDLAERRITAEGVDVPLEIDDYTRWRLLEGLDDIALTLRNVDDITAFETQRHDWLPVTG